MVELTILFPCLNEEANIIYCIKQAKKALANNNIVGEILIADNGSTDNSIKYALMENVRVISVITKGYGAALIEGTKKASGKYILMLDCDGTYNMDNLNDYINYLRSGYDLVMGNRFSGSIEKGAMPFINRCFGNPIFSYIGRKLFNIKVRDFHCGIRGYNKEKFMSIKLESIGMEYASEMIIKAHLNHFKICEIPTILNKSPYYRKKHLKPFKDGLRHLKIMFHIYSSEKLIKK